MVYEQRALVQPPPTAPQLANRQQEVHFLLDLPVTCAFPAHTSEFALQILDLTHVWSNRDSGMIDSGGLFALAAVVYMNIKLRLSPRQMYPHSLTELLTAFTALLVRQQPDDVLALHNAYTIQHVVQAEFRMLHKLGNELATLSPTAWVDIFRRRFTLRKQLQGDPLDWPQLAVRAYSLRFPW